MNPYGQKVRLGKKKNEKAKEKMISTEKRKRKKKIRKKKKAKDERKKKRKKKQAYQNDRSQEVFSKFWVPATLDHIFPPLINIFSPTAYIFLP